MTQPIDRIVEKFGTQQKLAEAIGCGQSVIAQWKRRGGVVPARRQIDILQAAKRLGIEVAATDFFPSEAA